MNELSADQESRAIQIHRGAIVVDAHCDTLLRVAPGRYIDKFIVKHMAQRMPQLMPQFVRSMDPLKLGEKNSSGCVDLPRLMEGGVDCQIFAIYVESAYTPEKALMRAMELLDAFYQSLAENMDRIALALSYGDVIEANEKGKVAAILSIEGAEAIQGNLGALRMLYRLGVRAMGLTHMPRNLLADGNSETRTKGGLTNLGIKVVEEMNKLGMIVDVSHLSKQGFWDVVQFCKDPFIASHSNAWNLCKIDRNLRDDQIKALARKDGVMGVNFVPFFLEKKSKATIETLLDHIDYVHDLIGPDHIGLGSDFDGGGRLPNLEDCTRMINITKGLVKRGYSNESIGKILGGNFLRVFKQVLK